jgi:hypothetical protein
MTSRIRAPDDGWGITVLIALIDQATVIQRILRHLGLPGDVPGPRPARAPPPTFWVDA